MYDLVIVGGGIAGLASAWYAQKADLSYLLLESTDRLGGLAQSEQVDGFGDSPFTVEGGPDGIITRKPWAYELAQEIGIDVVPLNDLPQRIYVWSDGQLHSLPDGVHLLVPTKVQPLLQSSLFSWPGKLRLLAEQFIPGRTENTDESVAGFIRRRFGQEALDKLGEPMLGGVYNADVEQMSMGATFGQFPALERKYGSLISGMKARMSAAQGNQIPALVSMRDGMGSFADALAHHVTGEVHLNTQVHAITRDKDGLNVTLEDEVIPAQTVVLTTPASVTAHLLREIAPGAVTGLKSIRYEGVGSVSLGYRTEDIPHALDAYGVVIPRTEKRQIDGITFASAKWENRAPDGYHLLRVFFGGPNTRDVLNSTDDEIVATAQQELREILGITAEPVMTRVKKLTAAYPQYDVGHSERIADIRAKLPAVIELAGLTYGGVGIPDTIRGAKEAVERISKRLPQRDEV
ncbi:MAG: protoporphyrinogen oxidase [Chloroflexota bacterium]